MKNSRIMTLMGLTTGLAALVGCYQEPTSFTVQTNVWIVAANPTTGTANYVLVPEPGIVVQGTQVGTNGSYSGTETSYGGPTGNLMSPPCLGCYQANDLELPAYYDHYAFESLSCTTITNQQVTYQTPYGNLEEYEVADVLTQNNQLFAWDCANPATSIPAPSSQFAMSGSIPSSITIPGQKSYSTAYGMPILYLFDGVNGTPSLAATVTASSVASGGGSATFPLPSSLAANSYGLITANATSSGTYQPNGVNLYAVGSSQSQTGAPFGVAVSGQTDNERDVETCDRGTLYSSNYSAFPVVSLYSQNQVLIGGQPVTVGQNPTAIAAFTGPNVEQTSSDDCDNFTDQYSGQTQGIVANSGGNTVSILDLVNDAVLKTITVGNQPVAIAVSSTGSTAYVANYTDSTVTQINLNTDVATTTIAVGGQPTSVALTAAGTLWVGGVGFLTEINTANMAVTATETTSKTIAALGYSDEVGQIVATTVDSSGNVYADQLNPASVTAGGTYTPANSVVVSSLGTHLNVNTNEYVRAFTGTLPSTLVPPTLNFSQPGGPPLVVYDAWVAVTATPTGFTITDIADNYVFASVSTPSPVTAIAVDPYLNVAYLTMPDSNLVWTVPLPGIGGT